MSDDAPAVQTRKRPRAPTANSLLERVSHGVYRLAGAPIPDHMELRAAWLRLAPAVPRWQRALEQGVVSHRSAAEMYGVGDLPADRHEFTVPTRRQSRRPDVRFHVRPRGPGPWIELRGLPVTRPSRIASDLLLDNEDPEAVAHIIGDSIRNVYDYPGSFAEALAPRAARFGLRRGDDLGRLSFGGLDDRLALVVDRIQRRGELAQLIVDPSLEVCGNGGLAGSRTWRRPDPPEAQQEVFEQRHDCSNWSPLSFCPRAADTPKGEWPPLRRPYGEWHGCELRHNDPHQRGTMSLRGYDRARGQSRRTSDTSKGTR